MARGFGEPPERSAGTVLDAVDYPITRDELVRAAEEERRPALHRRPRQGLAGRLIDHDEVIGLLGEAVAAR